MKRHDAQGSRYRAFLSAGRDRAPPAAKKTNFGEEQSISETEQKDEAY